MPVDHVMARAGADRETILFLVDEIRKDGLGRRCRALVARLARDVDVVLVAQCYLKRAKPAEKLGISSELYGFPAEGYDEKVAAFASEIADRHRPSWVVAYGWENGQLVSALDRLNLPIVSFTDYLSTAPNAESQINRTFRHATEILFSDETIPQSLTTALWGLEARDYKTLSSSSRSSSSRSSSPPHPAASTPAQPVAQPRAWHARLFRRPDTDHPDGVDPAAATLLETGRRAAQRRAVILRQEAQDAQLIEAAGGLNTDLAIRRQDDAQDAIAIYLRASQFTVPRQRVFAGRLLRRPIAGFNPLIYASDHPEFDEASGEDPLAHFLRNGRPSGRWTHDVIRPQPDAPEARGIRGAVHAHLHYPELLPELLDRLACNRSTVDLVFTTTSDARRGEIETLLDEAGVAARSIIVCANRGRDLWPFIELLQDGVLRDYDVVCHVHGKRSPHYDLGHIWRDFLWRHLIGGTERMVDVVLVRFASDPKLGLVFAEEPHLEGWEKNLAMATDLAARAGIALPLPYHFEYPMGTMFWVRPAALQPLLQAGLTREQIPEEPLAVDGTILHTLERLIPFFVAKAGFAYATTCVPGSVR